MKRFLLLLSLVGFLQMTDAQTITKIYGYWHYQAMGNIPRIPVEEGGDPKQAKTPERRKTYYLYVACNSSKTPVFSKVIIEGRGYNVTVHKITTLPVSYTAFNGKQDSSITLVPRGRKNIYVLSLSESDAPAVQAAKTAVTIEYKSGNTIKKATLARMKELPMPVVQ
jgi:hypothetical protein